MPAHHTTLRFVPSTRIVPGKAPDSYLCPSCRAELGRYMLRLDINGVPRRVDCAGEPCPACVEKFSVPFERRDDA